MSGTSPLGWFYLGQYASGGTVPVIAPPVGTGPGNGGEVNGIALNANGVTTTATLAAALSSSDALLSLTGDGGLPTNVGFCLTIGSETIYVIQIAVGSYRIRARAVGNTTVASHASGASATWTDSYDMAVASEADANASFTANLNSTGSTTYNGWLISFDSTQAYLGSSRYPMHVTELVGVFDAGAGVTGTNRLDASQPNAICTTAAVSDDCPAALSNPSLITTNIASGDVAVLRYTNPEASMLVLGARSAALQTWYGLKRVDATDHDVTLTDTNGIVVDTTGGEGTYTGSVNGEWLNPPGGLTTVTLPGTDRFFTRGSAADGYDEKGLPVCALAVRQGLRRVPYWHSPTWHNFNYVYSGFDTDATYVQVVINRNDVTETNDPAVALPGAQDISGPEATWDDNTYYFGASWYVVIFGTPFVLLGPALNGPGALSPGSAGANTAPVGVVSFPGGVPTTTFPPTVEDGSGGNIPPPTVGGSSFYATLV